MKPAALLLAIFSLCLLAPWAAEAYTPPVAEPGHYGGGKVTFTLTASGEIHNLKFNGRLVAHQAAHLMNERHFKFRHRVAFMIQHGECDWVTSDRCLGSINMDIPSSSYYGPHEIWHAHLLRD